MSGDFAPFRKPFWLLLSVLSVLCLLTAMNSYLLMDVRAVADSAQPDQEEASEEPKDPIFVEVGPMTVNLDSDNRGNRMLYAGLSIQVTDTKTQQQLKTHMPEVRSRLIMLLSDQAPDTLATTDGKDALKDDIVALLKSPLADGWPQPEVEGVFFSDFIVQ